MVNFETEITTVLSPKYPYPLYTVTEYYASIQNKNRNNNNTGLLTQIQCCLAFSYFYSRMQNEYNFTYQTKTKQLKQVLTTHFVF